jgi:hypothetical protein
MGTDNTFILHHIPLPWSKNYKLVVIQHAGKLNGVEMRRKEKPTDS